jgi:hypothetical protein
MVFIEPGMFSILGQQNVGLGNCGIKNGGSEYTYSEAVSIIKQIDKLLPSVPKHLQKRIWATRMGFVFAFGPDFESSLSCPIVEK